MPFSFVRPFGRALLFAAAATLATAAAALPVGDPIAASAREWSLPECIAAALRNNRQRPVSQLAVSLAEAQHRQSLAGYWPQLRLVGMVQRTDEAPDFIFPASTMPVPAQTIATPPSTALITIPAGVLGPSAVQLPVSVPAQTISTPASAVQVPSQDIKLMNRDSVAGSASVAWLLFDGGMRRGLRVQTENLVAAARQAARRTDLEIADSVTRLYYGAVLARELRQLGADTLARMDATLGLTETLYQGGGGKVTKADYLETKVMVDSLRAIVASLEKNEAMAEAALANTMGLPWQASVRPAAREIPSIVSKVELDSLVGDAYAFNPDWKQLEAGLRAGEAAVAGARSGYAPKVALTGTLHRWWNGYDAGMATAANKQGWNVGVGIELPLFDGLLTRGRVAEARARLEQLKQQQFLLREGIGLQIKDALLGLVAAQKACAATAEARVSAEENRALNVRAYQSELVETEKVIRSQLTEAFMSAQHLKARYDCVALQSQLNLLVGTEVAHQLGSAP
ncbi:MAG TPA: TolC family protein [Opitutaceae bacterium]|nr:TolC family protein [Opitutaceae bacterium]